MKLFENLENQFLDMSRRMLGVSRFGPIDENGVTWLSSDEKDKTRWFSDLFVRPGETSVGLGIMCPVGWKKSRDKESIKGRWWLVTKDTACSVTGMETNMRYLNETEKASVLNGEYSRDILEWLYNCGVPRE